jgi:hypothetical protein
LPSIAARLSGSTASTEAGPIRSDGIGDLKPWPSAI